MQYAYGNTFVRTYCRMFYLRIVLFGVSLRPIVFYKISEIASIAEIGVTFQLAGAALVCLQRKRRDTIWFIAVQGKQSELEIFKTSDYGLIL